MNITSEAGVYRWPLMSAYAASKAALVKLTETLAAETRPFGISVFSADPGLLPIGLGEAALNSHAGPQTPEGLVFGWIRGQLESGRGADGIDGDGRLRQPDQPEHRMAPVPAMDFMR